MSSEGIKKISDETEGRCLPPSWSEGLWGVGLVVTKSFKCATGMAPSSPSDDQIGGMPGITSLFQHLLAHTYRLHRYARAAEALLGALMISARWHKHALNATNIWRLEECL
eukprot:6466151-Amphidinium_carterae.1